MQRDRFERLEGLRVRETERSALHGGTLFERGQEIDRGYENG